MTIAAPVPPDDSPHAAAIRVLVVDDHAVFADALTRALDAEPDLTVVGSAGSTAGALDLLATVTTDVVIVDQYLGDGTGVRVARWVRSNRPETRVVMLSGAEEDDLPLDAMDAGCVGFVPKSQPLGEVIAAVRTVASGQSVISSVAMSRMLSARQARNEGDGQLTARECEILELVATGQPNRAIAEQLGLAHDTVRNHVARILRKLGAHSKLEAVVVARRRGFLDSSTR